MTRPEHEVVMGLVLPGLPHPLLCPERNPGWMRLRRAFEAARQELEQSGAELLLIYSTMWASVIGHQIQANPEPKWVHVDDDFHDLGSIPYHFKVDSEFAEAYDQICKQRGLHTRTVRYHGFPIDTGSVVALKLLNPDNRIPCGIVSSNVYADRAETIVLGKAAAEAAAKTGKKVATAIISTFSNRLHQRLIEPDEDAIHSAKDQEWNLKLLEFLEAGRLEDVAQLSRQVHREARVHKVTNFKPFWWLSAAMGAHNRYTGKVLAYEPVYGTGSAVVSLQRASHAARDLEFDEENPNFYPGDRNVLAPSPEMLAAFSSQQQSNDGRGDEENNL